MYSVCICSWWWDVHTCIYFVSSVVFVDFLIKSSFQKKKKKKKSSSSYLLIQFCSKIYLKNKHTHLHTHAKNRTRSNQYSKQTSRNNFVIVLFSSSRH